MPAIPLTKPCRKCGSDDIALYQLKNADYICRSCNKKHHKSRYVENRDRYIERAKKSYESTVAPYKSKKWAQLTIAAFKYNDKSKDRFPICNLTIDALLRIIDAQCSYCDDSTDKISVDRIDNGVGHIESNLVPSCYSCNSTRMNNWTHLEMKIIGKAVKEIKNIRRAL